MSDNVTQNEIGSLTQEQIVEWLRRWLDRNGNGIIAEDDLAKDKKEKRADDPHS